ncbi:hypothetical protein FRC08_013197 [Ceratobasidium sp. 394]|nr:hypothetical protein FRC08_013197 [Ceratobasidium sp. 394]KAG9094962.1 hypothetical protein FS749_011409 [Ceratobasidium sp. UAMH 11750]
MFSTLKGKRLISDWTSVMKPAADEALSAEDGVDRVHHDLVLGGVSDETTVLEKKT